MRNKIWDEVKTRTSLSVKGYFLYSPISILGFQIPVMVSNESESFWVLLLGGLLITIASFVPYILLIKLVNFNEKTVKFSFYAFFIIPIAVGLFRGYLFFGLIEYLDYVQPSGFIERLLSSSVNTLFWLCLANYVISTSNNFAVKYQFALNNYLDQKLSISSKRKLSEANTKILDNLQSNLAREVSKYIDKSDAQSFRKLSETLSNQINEEIRPLSRRIWIKNIDEYPVIKYRQLLKDAIFALRFSWLSYISILVALSLFGNLLLRSLGESLWRTFAFIVCLALIGLTFEKLRARLHAEKLYINLLTLFAAGLIPVYASEYLVYLLNYSSNWIATLFISPIAPVLMLVMSLLKLAKQDREILLNLLKNDSERFGSFIPDKEKIESAHMASYLHNSLQSELMALSRQLEEAAKEKDLKKRADLIERVAARVNRSIADDFISSHLSPRDRLTSVVDAWKGILDIQVLIKEERIFKHEKSSVMVQAIEEVATNLARYDAANVVSIVIEEMNSNFRMTFQSNGKGKLVASKGQGSAWFEKIASGPIQISKNAVGTFIEIEI